jgi:hypothetical protein
MVNKDSYQVIMMVAAPRAFESVDGSSTGFYTWGRLLALPLFAVGAIHAHTDHSDSLVTEL